MTPTVLEPEVESDPYLISLVRGGDMNAFGQLYERHVTAARRLARVLTGNPSDADDLVAETFTKVLTALRSGHGPDTAFRAYLLTAVRHAVYDRGKHAKRLEYTDDLTTYERPVPSEDPSVRALERSYAAAAFAKLPERWRAVLWHTEVEGESPAAIAPLLGLTPNGVAALAYRARERLRQMYLQEHIAVTESPRCHWTGMHLAGYVRAQLARRDRSKVEDHLAECARCRVLHRELTEENSSLRGVLATVLLGTAATGYLEDAGRGTGILAAIGAALAALWHWVTGLVNGFTAALKAGWLYLLGLPRRLAERYGAGNVAAASGIVGAGLAGVVTFTLVLVQSGPSGPPPPAALPKPAPAATQQAKPVLPPYVPSTVSPPAPPAPPQPVPTQPTAPKPNTPSMGAAGAPNAVAMADPSAAQLTAGEDGTLPVTVRYSESSAKQQDVQLTVRVPAGVSLRGNNAGDGWQCQSPAAGRIACNHTGPVKDGRTTAAIPVVVGGGLSGYQEIGLEIKDSAATTARIPVAPAGLRVAQALTGPAGFGLGGNALLACEPRPACLAADNNGQQMVPLVPEGREPSAPKSLPSAHAASGARITVPPAAKVAWAGLVYTASAKAHPAQLKVHGPGGAWEDVRLENARHSGGDRPAIQAIADVTELWQKYGQGDWWVAATGTDLPAGVGQFAGWSLAVTYRDETAKPAEIAIYVGPKPLREKQELSLQLGQGGDVDLGLVLWDGDKTLTGDSLLVDKIQLGEVSNLAGGRNASSMICALSTGPCAWRSPGLDVVRQRAIAGPGTAATLQAGGDPIEVGMMAVLTKSAG